MIALQGEKEVQFGLVFDIIQSIDDDDIPAVEEGKKIAFEAVSAGTAPNLRLRAANCRDTSISGLRSATGVEVGPLEILIIEVPIQKKRSRGKNPFSTM